MRRPLRWRPRCRSTARSRRPSLTEENVRGLSQLEPCGAGCPKPVLSLSGLTVEHAMAVGSGKHLRLRLQAPDGTPVQAIFFSAGRLSAKLRPGDRVDATFTPQINEFRGRRTVQLNLIDLRRVEPTKLYDRFRAHKRVRDKLRALAPDREDVIGVWNFLRRAAPGGAELRDNTDRLCLQIAASSPRPQAARRAIACLEILAELGLVSLRRQRQRHCGAHCAAPGRTHWKTACCSARSASSKQVIEWKPFRNTISA